MDICPLHQRQRIRFQRSFEATVESCGFANLLSLQCCGNMLYRCDWVALWGRFVLEALPANLGSLLADFEGINGKLRSSSTHPKLSLSEYSTDIVFAEERRYLIRSVIVSLTLPTSCLHRRFISQHKVFILAFCHALISGSGVSVHHVTRTGSALGNELQCPKKTKR